MTFKTLKPMALLMCATLVAPSLSELYADPVASTATTPSEAANPAANLPADELNSLVAPIALYPDELVSQILVASTYPLEVVQAQQWLQQNSSLKGQQLTAAAQSQPWDPSVQALVAFPDLLKRLTQDVAWLTNLGNAFLADQGKVMDAIQSMRQRAQEAGKLKSTEQQEVSTKTENGSTVVEIKPANPEVIYVPDYDPVWIWGPSPVYYPYPYWYYPPRPALGVWCWWGPPIVVSTVFFGWSGWAGWGWHPGWHHRSVIVNTNFVTVNHFNTVNVEHVRGVNVWMHSPGHRFGVAYPNRVLAHRYFAPGRPEFRHPTVIQAREQFRQSEVRVNLRHGPDRFGSRQIAPGVYNHNRSAFGGIEPGTNARAHSWRGNSSLDRTRPVNAPGGPNNPAAGGGPRSDGGHRGEGVAGGGHGFGRRGSR